MLVAVGELGGGGFDELTVGGGGEFEVAVGGLGGGGDGDFAAGGGLSDAPGGGEGFAVGATHCTL